jgi:plastocyanin
MRTRINKNVISISRGVGLATAACALLLFAKVDWATTHVVAFGGNAGFAYSPNSFTAVVGDTVKWEGDFSMHPLSSTTIPSGAQSWHNATGTAFTYVVAVPGTYNYKCDVHVGLGMTGSFQVANVAIRLGPRASEPGQTNRLRIVEIQGSKQPMVRISVPRTEFVSLSVFDLLGREISLALGEQASAGTYDVTLSGSISAGVYFVRLAGEGEASTGVLRVPR